LCSDPDPDPDPDVPPARGVRPDPDAEEPPALQAPLPWERGAGAEAIELELKAFCRAGELVYAAVVDRHGAVGYSVCTVGARPHNEGRIGALVGKVFATAELLGGEVGEREPQGLNLLGARWSYSLDPLSERHLLFGIYSSKAMPAIVRACAKKALPALVEALGSDDPT